MSESSARISVNQPKIPSMREGPMPRSAMSRRNENCQLTGKRYLMTSAKVLKLPAASVAPLNRYQGTRMNGLSRATFYRSFDTTVDVLRWKCSIFFKDMMASYLQTLQVSPETEDSLLLFVLRYCFSDIRIIEILLALGRPDIIYDCFQECIRMMLENYRSRGMKLEGIRNDYFVSIRTGYLLGIIAAWIQGGKRETAEEACAIVKAQHELVVKSSLIF